MCRSWALVVGACWMCVGCVLEDKDNLEDTAMAPCVAEIEICDGVDNDCDGEVDEGYDSDADGIPDCSDIEECDGLDNNGDGVIDEGFDEDQDGIADCFGEEICDGLDNDGDGDIDEDFPDVDLDGVADCVDEETCDGFDNDGDGEIDEGFGDSDYDGRADCVDWEDCDYLDNDGDGEIDEDWDDLDGDGVLRCCNLEEAKFFAAYGPNLESIQVYVSNGDNTFQPPVAVVEDGDPRILGVGFFDTSLDEMQILWKDNDDLYLTRCMYEWESVYQGTADFAGSSFGDLNGDGCIDMVRYDYPCCNFGNPNSGIYGTGDGLTALGNCDGTFETLTDTTWNVLFLEGNWTGGYTYNMMDWNADGKLDLVFWSVSSGGSGSSQAYYLAGNGAGDFSAAVTLPTVNDAGNSGDMGDVDGDGCNDWVLGPNDDGNDGAVHVVYGDCSGGYAGQETLVDNCSGSNCYGDGASRLVDWDEDGDLDLMTTYDEVQYGPRRLLFYENLGDGEMDESVTIAEGWDSSSFATPLFDL